MSVYITYVFLLGGIMAIRICSTGIFNRFQIVRSASQFSIPTDKFSSYEALIHSSDWDKVDKICRTFFGSGSKTIFPNQTRSVTNAHLQLLLEKVKKVTLFPMVSLETFEEDLNAIHFRENRTFLNLPYGEKVTSWPDRLALQSLIRNRFCNIFQKNDLVIVPGCADGQIPIEISVNSKKNNTDLTIIATDFNADAMNIGYLVMKSYGLETEKISWVQADATKKRFYDWIRASFPLEERHQVVTLVQPSLREQSFLSFLKYSASLPHHPGNKTTIVLPILLLDESSEWHKRCNHYVKSALEIAEKSQEAPQFIWSKTKYGLEMLKLNQTKSSYVPEQYFIRQESLSEIQNETGFVDSSETVFPLEDAKSKESCIIRSSISRRILCIWDTKT